MYTSDTQPSFLQEPLRAQADQTQEQLLVLLVSWHKGGDKRRLTRQV